MALFGAVFIFGLCDAANYPSPAVLLAWAFSLPIVGVASVLAGILAPSKPVASAKAFFAAAALYLMVAVLGPVSMGEGLGKTGSKDLGDLIAHGLLAPLTVIPLAMGISLLRWGKIRHEITFSKAYAKTLIKVAVVYLVAPVLSLLWLGNYVVNVPQRKAPYKTGGEPWKGYILTFYDPGRP